MNKEKKELKILGEDGINIKVSGRSIFLAVKRFMEDNGGKEFRQQVIKEIQGQIPELDIQTMAEKAVENRTSKMENWYKSYITSSVVENYFKTNGFKEQVAEYLNKEIQKRIEKQVNSEIEKQVKKQIKEVLKGLI